MRRARRSPQLRDLRELAVGHRSQTGAVADGRHATDRKARLRSDPVGVGALDRLAEVALEQLRIDAARPGDERQDRRSAASTAEDERLDDLALTDAERDGSLGGVPGSPANNLTFDGGSGGTLLINSAVSLNANRNVLLSANGTFNTNGYTLTIPGVIGGTGALAKTGAGTLTLSNANTFTGATTVNGGILTISTDGNLGAVPGAVTASHSRKPPVRGRRGSRLGQRAIVWRSPR